MVTCVTFFTAVSKLATMRQHSVTIVAVLILLAAPCRAVAQPPLIPPDGRIPLHGVCNQSWEQSLMTGSFYKLAIALEYKAVTMMSDLGSYDLCSMAPNSHYCTTYFGVMCVLSDGSQEVVKTASTCNAGPVLGVCVPLECSGDELSRQTQNFTRHAELFQWLFQLTSLCVVVPPYCTNHSYGFMSADCIDEQESFVDDPSAVAVFVVIVALCALSVVCALAGVYRRWSVRQIASTEERQELLNQGEGEPLPTQRLSIMWQVVAWFDLIENTRDFFVVKARSGGSVDTRFFEGVRTIAMLFVIYGHSLYFPATLNLYNSKVAVSYAESYASVGVFSAQLAVDTFFYLSGFLMFHLYVKYSEKRATSVSGELKNPPVSHIGLMYVRRYLRMTPVVMITLVFAVWLSVYIPTGVLHKAYWNQPTFQACKEQWWHQLLYITNLNDAAGWPDCMGWFWYLSTDFQLFLAAPLLVVPYFFDARAFLALMASGVIVITGLQTQLKYGAFLGDGSSYYDKPWMRANPYLFGMACAALVRSDHVKRLFATEHARWVSYAAGTTLMVTCINVMWMGLKCFEQKLNSEVEECSTQFFQFLNSYAVSAWGLGMSCVALPWALSSETGPIKWFLSTKPFAIASKLTFCCYMLHPIIILIVVAEGSQNPTFTPLIQYARFSGATVLTFLAAAILHLVVEVPFAKMNDALTRST
ncbi:acyltransferase, putative [Bodo saltans]|uniref:Acyltransferase, putative n=1 Tax=Bodo saltans TaxID=75058 RepID=A0A0S4J7P8_BODSA|nr:acyltransferase, putative [Bodo saltans]|eukprot:CUG87430.1 acyltransferase, putative [Bodo saltans]